MDRLIETNLEQHCQLVAAPRDVHEALLGRHLRLGADALLEAHQAVVVLARLEHALLVVGLRVLVSLAASETGTVISAGTANIAR